ncbi:hypothetical protein FE257_003709 [Aspergillus nanangensis]|uniref:Uncharacterized protein n=1 Tax=Aspergillus nanangensis TaxID=2582783 RepID=A0AAD4CSK5_ASPNN|nr:hypothetical protein FE257_003709 [Aspergillus nanangensis]
MSPETISQKQSIFNCQETENMKFTTTLTAILLAALPACSSGWRIHGRRFGNEMVDISGTGTECVRLQRPFPGNRALTAELESNCRAFAYRSSNCTPEETDDLNLRIELTPWAETKVQHLRKSVKVECLEE